MELSFLAAVYIFTFAPLAVIPFLILFKRAFLCSYNSIKTKNVKKPSIPLLYRSRRENFKIYMETSTFGRYFMLFQIGLTIGSIALYIYETYSIENWGDASAELAITFLFILDYAMCFYASEDKLKYYFSLYSLIDLLTILPVLGPIIVSSAYGRLSDVPTVLRVLRALRALRILKLFRLLSFSQSDARRQTLLLFLTILELIFLTTAFVNAIESWAETTGHSTDASLTTFHDSLYFTIVSFSTVGYGDLHPTTIYTRVLMMSMILIIVLLIPLQTSRLIYYLNQRNPLATRRFHPRKGRWSHVILTGAVTYTSTVDFLREFFSGYHENDIVQLVILMPNPPADNFRALLRHPFYRRRVKLLAGSPLSSWDLVRVKAESAKACFVLANLADHLHNDKDTISAMYAISIKHYYPHLPVYVQLMDSTSKELAVENDADRVVCIEELKMGILAKNCTASGFSTLITNLVRNYGTDDDKNLAPWLKEYAYGAAHHLHSFPFPSAIYGRKFSEVALEFYEHFQVMLFAIDTSTNDFNRRDLILNPQENYSIRAGDIGFIVVSKYDEFLVALNEMYVVTSSASPKERVGRLDSLTMAALKDDMDSTQVIVSRRQSRMSRMSKKLRRMSTLPGDNPAAVFNVFTPTNDTENNLTLDSQTTRRLGSARSKLEHIVSGPEHYRNEHAKTIEECTIDEVEFENHIIVCGSWKGLRHFVHPLRFLNIGKIIPIVLIHDQGPTKEIWKPLAFYPEIYFLKGTPLQLSSLRKAGIASCYRLVILLNNQDQKDELLVDSDSIFITKAIESRYPNVFPIIELAHGANMILFSPKDDWQISKLTAIRALLDDYSLHFNQRKVLLEATGNKYLAQRGQDMSWSRMVYEKPKTELLTISGVPRFPPYHYEPYFASGQVYTSAVLDVLLCQLYYEPHLLDIVTLLIGTHDCSSEESQLYQIDVPPTLVGKTYFELFSHLILSEQIPMGLYRSAGTYGSAFPYVYTNPPGNTIINSKDKIFVLMNSFSKSLSQENIPIHSIS